MKVCALAFAFLLCVIVSATPGAPEDYSPTLDSSEVKFAVEQINDFFEDEGDNASRTAVRIVSASRQLVSGYKYDLRIEVTGGSYNEICRVVVWSQSWLEKEEDQQKLDDTISCNRADPRPGVPVAIDTLDREDVQAALRAAEDFVNKQSNSLLYLVFQGVESVTSQVVNGINYSFKGLKLAPSSCSQNAGFQSKDIVNDCPVDSNASPLFDEDVNVWWSPQNKQTYQVSFAGRDDN